QRARAAPAPRQAQRSLRAELRRDLPRPSHPDARQRLRRLRRAAAPLRGREDEGGRGAVRAAVVGGGLAGLAAALELTKQGHEVHLFEARPTLGGAVQTLPEREGDPSPPPDNGQHVALGCCTAYLGFVEEIGRSASLRRVPLGLPVVAEDGSVATIRPGLVGLLRYSHIGLGER